MAVTTSTFDLDRALNGAPVGIGGNVDETAQVTGILERNGNTGLYKTFINGFEIICDKDGVITSCTPADPDNNFAVGVNLLMIEEVLTQTQSFDEQTTTHTRSGYSSNVSLASMEPRDEFATKVLGVLLQRMEEKPETVNDSKILMFCRAAYRWANGMMVAASNARVGTAPPSGQGTVTVNEGDLQSNTEKLLYNMVAKMTDIKTQLAENKTQLHNDLDGIGASVETIAENFEIPDVGRTITIKASIFNTKYIRLELLSDMCYSDVSVFLNLTVSENGTSATRNVGYVLPRGSVVMVEALDDAVTSITSINSESVRGQGAADPNEYAITT